MSGTAIRLGRMAIILMLGTPMVIGGLSLFRAVAGRQLCWLSHPAADVRCLGSSVDILQPFSVSNADTTRPRLP